MKDEPPVVIDYATHRRPAARPPRPPRPPGRLFGVLLALLLLGLCAAAVELFHAPR